MTSTISLFLTRCILFSLLAIYVLSPRFLGLFPFAWSTPLIYAAPYDAFYVSLCLLLEPMARLFAFLYARTLFFLPLSYS
jgi:hypothetical protein